MEKIVIIAIIALAVFVVVYNFSNPKKIKSTITKLKEAFSSSDNSKSPARVTTAGYSGRRDVNTTTVRFAKWQVVQLNKQGQPISTPQPVQLKDDSDGNRVFTIGAGDDCDFVLKDSMYASTTHLIVSEDAEGFFAVDNASTNGTYIDEMKVENSFKLEHKRVVYLADTPICFYESHLNFSVSTPAADNIVAPDMTSSFAKEDVREPTKTFTRYNVKIKR